jgi:hypothetical protein
VDLSPIAAQPALSEKPTSRPWRVRSGWADSRVARLGVVYADHLRLTIMTELWHREMSSKEFFDEIGGASLGAIRNHFKVLVENEWLSKVGTRPQRRGRPQHVYRATEQAVFDDESWAGIPISIRDTFTAQLLVQLSERLAFSLDPRATRAAGDFTYLATHNLSESGWQSSVGAVNRCYGLLAQLHTRVSEGGHRCKGSIPMLVASAAFEGPSRVGVQPAYPGDRVSSGPALQSKIPWNVRLAKVFVDQMSLDIVNLLDCDAMSAPEVAQHLDTYPQAITKRFNALVQLNWIRREERLDTQEHFYRAVRPTLSSSEIFEPIHPSRRAGPSWETYRRFVDRGVSAVNEGLFNSRPDRHLTWNVLSLDEEAWNLAQQVLRSCEEEITAIRRETAASSIRRSNPFTLFLAGLPSTLLPPPFDRADFCGQKFLKALR